jgi:hypothetical protein
LLLPSKQSHQAFPVLWGSRRSRAITCRVVEILVS